MFVDSDQHSDHVGMYDIINICSKNVADDLFLVIAVFLWKLGAAE